MFEESAQSVWDVGLLDVAFMFDISGSMDTNNRINSLKNAANDALDVLLPEGNESLNEGVRIAMVAYDDMINAGQFFEDVTGLAETRYYYATDYYRDWKKVGEEEYTKRVCEWVEPRTCSKRNESGKCTKWTGGKRECRNEPRTRNINKPFGPQKKRTIRRKIKSTCVWERPGDYAFTDFGPTMKAGDQPRITVPVSRLYDTDEIIYNASEIEGNPHGFMAAAYAHFWRDRLDHKDGWRRAGEKCSGIEPLALTRDRSKLEKYISALKTRNGTAGHQGIAWSWYLISDKWAHIFDGDSAPLSYDEAQGNKALILMTDGDFIDQRFKNEQGTSDTQARALCDQIKAQGKVQIYTVAFQAPLKGEEVLEYCASNPQNAFTADNEEELREAYNKIAGSLSELRLSK
ncbi:MAG: VWA domain-containing protein [Pseudomonadota bacterium]